MGCGVSNRVADHSRDSRDLHRGMGKDGKSHARFVTSGRIARAWPSIKPAKSGWVFVCFGLVLELFGSSHKKLLILSFA
jgi:hypothetical protein